MNRMGCLLGMLVGWLAQGVPVANAAALAVHVHGEVADALAATQGHTGLLAGDLSAALGAKLRGPKTFVSLLKLFRAFF